MLATDAKSAYPSSAPPLPYSFSSFITGFHGPRLSFHPSISGCLSRWPYINILPSLVPGISKSNNGVLPGDFFMIISEPSGLFFSVQSDARFKTFSM